MDWRVTFMNYLTGAFSGYTVVKKTSTMWYNWLFSILHRHVFLLFKLKKHTFIKQGSANSKSTDSWHFINILGWYCFSYPSKTFELESHAILLLCTKRHLHILVHIFSFFEMFEWELGSNLAKISISGSFAGPTLKYSRNSHFKGLSFQHLNIKPMHTR
jgi:hypothetical protein